MGSRRGRWPAPIATLIAFGMLGPVPAAAGDRPDSPAPPALSDFGYAANPLTPLLESGPSSFGAGFDPNLRAFLQPALPPVEVSVGEPPWQAPPSVEWHHAENALPREPRIHIPEPASIVLLTTGLIGLAARRHLRRMRA